MRVGKGPPKPATPKHAGASKPLRVGVPSDRKAAPPVVDHRHEPTQAASDKPDLWRTAKYDYRALALRWDGRAAVCVYGCGGTTANVSGIAYHAWNCQYWDREGKDKSPF